MALRALTITAATAALISMGLAGCASAAGDMPATAVKSRASIPFAALGGIKYWTAPNDRTILVQASNGTWYRADLMSECLGLRTSNAIAFVTDPDYALTKFGSVMVDGRRCWFKSFEKTAPPPKSSQSREHK